jgi:hypothetical protein
MLCCLQWRDLDASRVRGGYILGLAGTRGYARSSATHAGAPRRTVLAVPESESACKPPVDVAHADAKLTPSFARKEVDGISSLTRAAGRFDQPGLAAQTREVEIGLCDARASCPSSGEHQNAYDEHPRQDEDERDAVDGER